MIIEPKSEHVPEASQPPQPQTSATVEEPETPRTSGQSSSRTPGSQKALYTLEVALIGGPITEEFIEQNPSVIRTLEIKGSQTLQDLHQIIFKAFDREEEHLHEFQIGGEAPQDPKADRYGPQPMMMPLPGEEPVGDVATTTIASLGLAVDEPFGYWFDFGDDWWHQINVVSISDPVPKRKYPRITERMGASPPQYPDLDDE